MFIPPVCLSHASLISPLPLKLFFRAAKYRSLTVGRLCYGAVLPVQNTRETCHAIRGMTLTRARAFLTNVVNKREAVAFCRFNGGVGRNPQIKTGSTQGRWPEKSARYLLDLLQNAESNAELQGLDTAQLYVHHIQANQAPKLRRRTYRAHGRINPYMSSPSHIELVLNTKAEKVKKANEDGTVSRSRKGKSSQLQQGATGFEQ